MKWSEIWFSIAAFLLVIAFGIFMWHVQRKWHYNWSYKSMVQDTVREMVKQEALK